MTEPKNGRPIFFPENLVLLGNLALFLWIVIDTVAFLLYDFAAGIAFFIVTIILIYGVLHLLGCLRPCYNCIKCTHGMGRLAALYFGRRIFKRLQIQLQTAHSDFFHIIHRRISRSIRTLLSYPIFLCHQSGGICGSPGVYDLQCLNLATKKTKNPKRGSVASAEFNVIRLLSLVGLIL